jgi:hypothetical protein
VMMNRGKDGAHAQVEQTNDRCDGSHHSDDARNVRARDAQRQAELKVRPRTTRLSEKPPLKRMKKPSSQLAHSLRGVHELTRCFWWTSG